MRKPPTPLQAERKRARALLRSYLKRGYTFQKEFVKRILEGKRTKLQTYKGVTPEALQKKGKAISPTTGKKISGTEYRKLERSASAKKGAFTRKYARPTRTYSEDVDDFWGVKEELEERKKWEQKRRKQDFIDYDNAGKYQEGVEAYNRLEEMINQYEGEDGSGILRGMLNREISKYGKAGVIKSIAQSPDEAIELAERLMFYKKGQGNTGYLQLMTLIRAQVPTMDERTAIGDYIDREEEGYED